MIVLNSMMFSGSNLIWNLIRSHPMVDFESSEFIGNPDMNFKNTSCIKALENNIPLCSKSFDFEFRLGLIRNPLCYLDAKLRRGVDVIETIAEQYATYYKLIHQYSDHILLFDDFLNDVFQFADHVFEICNLPSIDELSFRSKPFLRENGSYFAHDKKRNNVTRENVYDIIDRNIDLRQIENIPLKEKNIFLKELEKLQVCNVTVA